MNSKLIVGAGILCSSINAFDLSSLVSISDSDYYSTDLELDEVDKTDPDFSKTFQEIVAENGYGFETHPVTTDDGYILNVFRITDDSITEKKGTVFLMHGVTDSADCWIMHTPDVAPAFQLLKEGYDVWLGNQRGTKYSMGHTHLNPKTSKAYWEFSWTEMGDYDAPAQVDFVRSQTKTDKVTYIGHSQGTTQMFYGIAKQEEFWKERLNLYVALAPVTRIDHCGSDLFVFLSNVWRLFEDSLYLVHVYSILGPIAAEGTKIACGIMPEFCKFAEGFLITSDPSLDNTDRFQVYMGHFPAGASVQSLVHYAQMIKEKDFYLYDWGSKSNNQARYGQDTPPIVDLTQIHDLPMAMFVGSVDDLGDLTDNQWARDQIMKGGDALVHYEVVPAGHSTFMVGNDMSYFKTVLGLVDAYTVGQ